LRNIEAAHRGKKIKSGFVWALVPTLLFVKVGGRFAPTYGLEFLFLNLVFALPSPVHRRVAQTRQG
jgi:hypothetical protein